MKLTVKSRLGARKSEAKQSRRQGEIPAVVYSPGQPNALVVVNEAEFGAALRGIKQGQLPTTVFTLNINNKETNVVVKDIQYHPTTYRVIHLDFQELVNGSLVRVRVPITCTHVADCAGVKLGGFLRQVIRHLKVECTPDRIPTEILVSVRDLGIKQKKRLSDLVIPEGVKPLAAMEEVVVVIAKK